MAIGSNGTKRDGLDDKACECLRCYVPLRDKARPRGTNMHCSLTSSHPVTGPLTVPTPPVSTLSCQIHDHEPAFGHFLAQNTAARDDYERLPYMTERRQLAELHLYPRLRDDLG